MEYLILIIASLLAGVGTGLVGLSAATVMVPLLVVLCPSFQGVHGAFMATAIALASDILGSAVTSYIYAKNKKIDLKHGWILLVCIISMCIAGSIAAFFVHQSVLGGFSLILCVAIGIRFLLKPDSKKKESLPSNQKLNWKQIAVSLFFGLTIGFGTGFFGSGGGMMMLIVFTAFLGYDRKSAVGTSTFIMTFTALIAAVSHVIMEPTILFERWDFLVIAIVVATTASLISAQFANKVNTKIVGYLTGAILFILGLVLVFLNYKDSINMVIFMEIIKLFGIFVGYIAALALILIIVRYTTKVPDYVFRKLLHMVAISTILPLCLFTDKWWIALIVDSIFIILIIIVLLMIENLRFYKHLFVEKRKHEVIVSFVTLFIMIGCFVAFFWGLMTEEYKYLAIAAIMAWGPGDGMAAIIGIRFGKPRLKGKFIEGTKSIAGCLAMLITSFICTFAVLLIFSQVGWYIILPISFLVGVVSMFVELFTKKGYDTITVPIAAGIVLCLLFLF